MWISGEDQDVVIIRFGNSPFGSLLITKLSDDNKRSPIPNTDFLLTYSDGTFVGNDNGIYTTNAAGEILVDGLEPGVTIIVREVRAAAGFLLDESPQHIQIKSGETVHLQFLNKPLGNLIIKKNSSAPTQEAVPGAEFEITYADGSYVDAAGGTISSNGRYVTDEHGEIRISGIVGTVVVTEIKSGPGYQLDEATGVIDYDAMERKALECKPKLIVGGASAYSREWDYKRMREIADKVGALLMVDMAHTAGLIAAGLLENPVKYAHIVTSTTHKTLRGPRGGIILMGKDFENPWGQTTPKGAVKMMSQILNSAVFPGIQGGPLEHVIAAKAVAFGEALEPAYKEYQTQVQKNAAAMAAAFVERGYKIVSGGTDNHLMLVDLRTKFPELTGKLAEKCLVAADITTNKNMVPFDSRSPFQTSGLRFGTPAITTRGLKEDKMDYIVGLIDRVLHDPENEANIAAVRKDVNALMADYPLFAW